MKNRKRINYIVQTLGVFLNRSPKYGMVLQYTLTDSIELQDFVSCNLKREFEWASAIGIIESAIHIVDESFANGNIKEDE